MSAEDPYVGTVFGGRFRIESLLAAGGMGTVYVAEQQPSGRKVALKLIKGKGAVDAGLVARFQREIGVMSGLNHPNVVTMFDSGVDNGNFFLVMELLEGRSLRDELSALSAQRQVRVPWPRALRITHHVARGLAAVHEIGVVHRDLKPENIFLTTSTGLRDFAKLLDFGIVRRQTTPEPQRLTETGNIVGTPGYLSPEQLTGEAASARSDLYALGVVLYEMVTGEFPFAAPTLQAMALRQLVDPLTSPGRLAPDLPEHVVDLVLALMAREPAQRPSTEALLLQLEDLLSETSGPVQRPPSRPRTALAAFADDNAAVRRAQAAFAEKRAPPGATLPTRPLHAPRIIVKGAPPTPTMPMAGDGATQNFGPPGPMPAALSAPAAPAVAPASVQEAKALAPPPPAVPPAGPPAPADVPPPQTPSLPSTARLTEPTGSNSIFVLPTSTKPRFLLAMGAGGLLCAGLLAVGVAVSAEAPDDPAATTTLQTQALAGAAPAMRLCAATVKDAADVTVRLRVLGTGRIGDVFLNGADGDFGACLRKQLALLTVTAPGTVVDVEFPLRAPTGAAEPAQ